MTSWRILIVSGFLLLGSLVASAANQPSQRSIVEGEALAAELRMMKPEENLEVKGFIKIRDGDGKRTKVRFRYQIVVGDKSWQSIYETQPAARRGAEKLIVVKAENQPNRYVILRSNGTNTPSAESLAMSGDRAMVPFANSDFWLADLGLEFLHWPKQRIVEEAKIKMRKGRPCKVLESVNPHPGGAGYTRVRSWIDAKTGKPILAEAYGPDDKLLKEFEVGSLTKVNGQWELKNLEMRNARTDSHTILEFNYEQKATE
ncbi:MAG: hypothetical protein DME21_06415 [Verrucomicrobia bacterium]|nr:MAG: hypothetical protein DME21_06415 [Verrucomicrobiota bacterium]